jgi:hypothetical protein
MSRQGFKRRILEIYATDRAIFFVIKPGQQEIFPRIPRGLKMISGVMEVKKRSMFLFLFFRYLFEVDDLCSDILGDLLQLKFPEMGQFYLDLAPGDGHNPEHGLLDTFTNLHPFPHIDFQQYLFTSFFMFRLSKLYLISFSIT